MHRNGYENSSGLKNSPHAPFELGDMSRFTLPYDNHPPTLPPKRGDGPFVSLPIPLKFREPKVYIRLRRPSYSAAVSVPETPVHKDREFAAGVRHVRPSRNSLAVKPIAHTETG